MSTIDSPKASIILPVYNVVPYIRQCLDALVHQTLREIEIILINDGSTDGSGEICDEYAARDFRIRVIHNEVNIRQGLSRNRGIEIARGEYLAFLDPDDWVDLDYYEKLWKAAKKNDADIAKTISVMVWAEGKTGVPGIQNSTIRKGLRKNKPIYQLFTHEHWTAIFRTELVRRHNIRYANIRNAEDDVFLLQYGFFAKKMVLIDNTRHYYRQHPQSTINVRGEEYYDAILSCFHLQLDFLHQQDLPEHEYKQVIIRYMSRLLAKHKELSINPTIAEYRKEYFTRIIQTLARFETEPEWYLEAFMLGSDRKDVYQQLPGSRMDKLIRNTLQTVLTIRSVIQKMKRS